MAKPEIEGFPTPSLIDRLSNEEPDYFEVGDGETNPLRRQMQKTKIKDAQRRYEDAVRRDLEWLFNTRRVKDDRLVNYPQVQSSVYYYGLPDLNSEDPSRVHDRDEFLRNMEEAIARFDHRLQEIHIELVPAANGTHILQFQIAGIVLMDPVPAEVAFQTQVDPVSGDCKVK